MRRFACFAILLGVAICSLANGVVAETEMDSEAMRDAMTARALDELGYKVLMPGAHETADCRALQKAFDAASSVLDANTRNGSKCFTMMQEFKKIDCVILSRVGAVGGNVMGELEEAKQALLRAKVAIQNGFNAAVDKTKEVAKAAGNAIATGANKAVEAGKNALDWLKKKVSFKNAPLPDAGDLYAAIVTGAREPDLPCGDRDAAIAACLKAVAKGGIFSGVAGAILSKANIAQAQVDATTKAIEVQQFSPQARASHFGYMSIGHSQTANRPGDHSVPGVVQVLEDSKVWDKQRYKFPRRTKQVKSATQQDVADLIADWELHLLEQGLTAVGHKKYDFFVYHLARFGHTIMDSFSCAHAVRLADAGAGYPVMYFMDYGSQDGGQHSKNGDELPGDPPFNAHVAGFKYGIDLVAKGMQIFLHAAVAKETGKPYVKVYPSYTGPANPKNEMTWFLNTKVYHFAAPGFAKHSAAGCVTKDTVAPGKEKDICKIGTTKGYLAQAASKASSVCPDRPLPFEQVFVPGGESAVSSSSSHGSSSVSKATKPGPGGAKTPSKTTKKN